MFNVITETATKLPDMSRSFINNYKTSYIWITPYACELEANKAVAYIHENGSSNAVTTVEAVK